VIGRMIAALVLFACAVVLVLFARDTWRWQRALAGADARARVTTVSPDAWDADTVLPWGPSRRVLGIDRDLSFRRTALMAAAAASRVPSSATQRQRTVIETALGRVERDTSRPGEAAVAADELGVLAYADPPSPSQAANPYLDPAQGPASGQLSPDQRAEAQFALAATLDPTNDNALRNLEIMLRAPQANPAQDTTHTGSGDQFGHKGSGSRPPGRGY
jgi:hypothetical protein